MKEYRLKPHAGPFAGRVQVALPGFHGAGARQLVSALAVLPDFHLAGLRYVKFDPDRGVVLAGWYDREALGIHIFYAIDIQDLLETLYHEIGHHVFWEALTIDQRADWVMVVSPGEGSVSPYAERNAREDFAETYAWHMLDYTELASFESKLEFMHEVVFRGFVPEIIPVFSDITLAG